MKIKTYQAGKTGTAEFDASVFGEQVLYRTLKESVLAYQANQRLGTHDTRGREQVVGSNRKPWKQKHTGRARAGDRKSPIWRGGGVVFGPHPRDYRYPLPIKERRVALRSALLGKLRDEELVQTSLSGFDKPSAKAARKLLADLGAPRRALIVLHQANENAWKSFRNFPGVKVRTARELCAFDVVAGGLIVAEDGVLPALAARVGLAASKS